MQTSFFKAMPAYYMVPNGKGLWVSNGPLIFYSSQLNVDIVVPAGSVNDLASVPWVFRCVVPPNGPSRPAAALHDYLYEVKGKLPLLTLSREQCDKLFLEAMLSCKPAYWNTFKFNIKEVLCKLGIDKSFNFPKPLVHKYMANIMYLGVRLGGWVPFNKK